MLNRGLKLGVNGKTDFFIFYSPLMTGVNTAMPSKFGLLTVLSRIRPPILGRRQQYKSELKKKALDS